MATLDAPARPIGSPGGRMFAVYPSIGAAYPLLTRIDPAARLIAVLLWFAAAVTGGLGVDGSSQYAAFRLGERVQATAVAVDPKRWRPAAT